MKKFLFLLLVISCLFAGCNVTEDKGGTGLQITELPENSYSDTTTLTTIPSTTNIEDTTLVKKSLFEVDDVCTESNNIFAYNGVRIGEYDTEFQARIIWTKSIENISSEPQAVNIRINFYDENEELIVSYQHKEYKQEYEANNPFHLMPNETNNASFTIYDDDLPEGKSLANVKYYSIEDIVY